jgi:hypothetical protein
MLTFKEIGMVNEKNILIVSLCPGNTNWGRRLSTINLLIKVVCFVK